MVFLKCHFFIYYFFSNTVNPLRTKDRSAQVDTGDGADVDGEPLNNPYHDDGAPIRGGDATGERIGVVLNDVVECEVVDNDRAYGGEDLSDERCRHVKKEVRLKH